MSLWSLPLSAQVLPDTTLPANGRSELEVGGDCITTSCTIIGGSRVGENLFHSFSSFALQNGLEASFAHDPGVVRIFSRITSGNESFINGKLKTASASLFFLNPEGILFGPQAQIDIRNTFIGTSANRILTAGGGRFSGRDFNDDQLFNGAPTTLSFPRTTGAIRLTGNPSSPVFNPDPGKTLALIGGSITLTQRSLLVPQEQLFLGGFKANPGGRALLTDNRISLTVAPAERVENVTLTQTSIVADPSAINGEVRIRADNATLTQSLISTLANQQESRDGNIRFSLAGGMLTLAESQLVARSTAAGHSGNISVGDISTNPFNDPSLVDSISLRDSQILTETEGDGGRIQFANVNGTIGLNNSTIETQTGSNSSEQAGGIFLGGERLSLNSNSRIQTTNRGIDLDSQVGNLNLRFEQGVDLSNSTIAALVQPNNNAAAGSINLDISDGENDVLELDQGSQIFSETFAAGGDINIATGAGDIELDNASKIFAIAAPDGSFASNLTLTAEDLEVFGGSQITTETPASGGNLSITLTDKLTLQQGSLIQAQAGRVDSGFLTISAQELNGTNNNQDNDIIAIGPQNNLILEGYDRIDQFVLIDPPQQGNSRSEIGYRLVLAPENSPPENSPPENSPITSTPTPPPPVELPSVVPPPIEPPPLAAPPIEAPSIESPLASPPSVSPSDSPPTNTPPLQEPAANNPFAPLTQLASAITFGPNTSNDPKQNAAPTLQTASEDRQDIALQCHSTNAPPTTLSLSGRGGVPPMTGSQRNPYPLVDLGMPPSEIMEGPEASSLDNWQKLMAFYDANHTETNHTDANRVEKARYHSNFDQVDSNPMLVSPLAIGDRLNHQEAQAWLQLSEGRVRLTRARYATPSQPAVACDLTNRRSP